MASEPKPEPSVRRRKSRRARELSRLDLARSFCTNLAFGADIELSPSQVGTIRDTVLAMYPAAALPWYFRETYQVDEREYEVAASVSPSTGRELGKPYNVYVRFAGNTRAGDYEGPSVRDLFQMLSHETTSLIYCSVDFAMMATFGSPIVAIPSRIAEPLDHVDGGLDVEQYGVAAFGQDGARQGSILVRPIGSDAYHYTVSFFEPGTLSADFPEQVFSRAINLVNRVHQWKAAE